MARSWCRTGTVDREPGQPPVVKENGPDPSLQEPEPEIPRRMVAAVLTVRRIRAPELFVCRQRAEHHRLRRDQARGPRRRGRARESGKKRSVRNCLRHNA